MLDGTRGLGGSNQAAHDETNETQGQTPRGALNKSTTEVSARDIQKVPLRDAFT
jgi:hypothetical protein